MLMQFKVTQKAISHGLMAVSKLERIFTKVSLCEYFTPQTANKDWQTLMTGYLLGVKARTVA
jgi:hypothetical protein